MLTLQLTSYEGNGCKKIFEASFSEVPQGSVKINAKEVFSALACVPELNLKADKAKTELKLENIPKMGGMRNNGTLELSLREKGNGPELDNFMMMAMLEDKFKEVSANGKRL